MSHYLDSDTVQEYKEMISRRGGEATKAKYGTDHFRKLGQQSAAKRKARKEAQRQGTTIQFSSDPSGLTFNQEDLSQWIATMSKELDD